MSVVTVDVRCDVNLCDTYKEQELIWKMSVAAWIRPQPTELMGKSYDRAWAEKNSTPNEMDYKQLAVCRDSVEHRGARDWFVTN